jgi:hypothetical protein
MFYLRPFIEVADAAERLAKQVSQSATLLRRRILLTAQLEGKRPIAQREREPSCLIERANY